MTDEGNGASAPSETGTAVALSNKLTKRDILDAKDIFFQDVEVPEWGGTVVIKTLTGTERDAFEASMIRGVGKTQQIDMQQVRAKFCSLIIVDPDTHERMFTKPEIEVLGKKSAPALERVYDKGMEMSKFTKEDIEEMVGNSDSGPPAV